MICLLIAIVVCSSPALIASAAGLLTPTSGIRDKSWEGGRENLRRDINGVFWHEIRCGEGFRERKTWKAIGIYGRSRVEEDGSVRQYLNQVCRLRSGLIGSTIHGGAVGLAAGSTIACVWHAQGPHERASDEGASLKSMRHEKWWSYDDDEVEMKMVRGEVLHEVLSRGGVCWAWTPQTFNA